MNHSSEFKPTQMAFGIIFQNIPETFLKKVLMMIEFKIIKKILSFLKYYLGAAAYKLS